MSKNNPFDVHGISHLSASNINLFIQDRPKWIMSYLFNIKESSSPQAIRGQELELGISQIFTDHLNEEPLLTPKDIKNKFISECNKAEVNMNSDKYIKEENNIEDWYKFLFDNFFRREILGNEGSYSNFLSYQQKIEVYFEDLAIPFIGYIDFLYKDMVVDLKTTKIKTSKVSESHKRQMAVYSMAHQNKIMKLVYSTPKAIWTQSFKYKDLENYRKVLEYCGFAIQKFLSVSKDKYELASMFYPDYDSWMWSEELKYKSKEIWR